jgi:hypothetical protein
MNSNMLQSVENFNVQANILGNYVRDVNVCTQVYYSFIEISKTRLGTQIMLPSQFVDFLEQIWCYWNYYIITMECKNEIYEFWAHKCDCWYFIQILNVQIRIVRIFMIFRWCFMGSNNSWKQVSFQKNSDRPTRQRQQQI